MAQTDRLQQLWAEFEHRFGFHRQQSVGCQIHTFGEEPLPSGSEINEEISRQARDLRLARELLHNVPRPGTVPMHEGSRYRVDEATREFQHERTRQRELRSRYSDGYQNQYVADRLAFDEPQRLLDEPFQFERPTEYERTTSQGKPEPRKQTVAELFPALANLEDKKVSELLDLIDTMARDWMQLNEIHNKRAIRNHWCPEYENNQSHYNGKFSVLKLHGREVGFKYPPEASPEPRIL